ncbi:unnamed protein product, partial [marine sediment metagenome]
DYGIFVDFDEAVHRDSNVYGSIHFAKINDTYLYTFELGDELLYKYDILNDDTEYIGGNLHLELNVGFKDVIYSELTQVICHNYTLDIELFRMHTDNDDEITLHQIGKTTIPLDTTLLGYHQYAFDISISDFFSYPEDQEEFIRTIMRGTSNDLYVRINSSIVNCYVDGHLFKGMYAHELVSASMQIQTAQSQLLFNDDEVDTPYILISQDDVVLTKVEAGSYLFGSNALLYDFNFILNKLRTDSTILYNNTDYTFDYDSKTITLNGVYRDYSGYIFANISYKAFEWQSGSISTLEPITVSFN